MRPSGLGPWGELLHWITLGLPPLGPIFTLS